MISILHPRILSFYRFPSLIANKGWFERTSSSTALVLSSKVDLGDVKVKYKVVGTGSQTLLCLPGIIGSIETDFEPILEPLAKSGFRVVAWDPPGYGESRPPNRDFSGDFYQRDALTVARMMEKLGYEKYGVLGWSNGGVTGTFLAANSGKCVTKLVIWGAHAYADTKAVIFSQMMGNLDNWSDKMKGPMLALYGQETLQKMLDEWGNSVANYQKLGLDANLKDAMTRISCPTLIIHGELDPIVGIKHAEFLNRNIQNSKLKIFPNGKHNLHLRFRNEFLSIIIPFLLEK